MKFNSILSDLKCFSTVSSHCGLLFIQMCARADMKGKSIYADDSDIAGLLQDYESSHSPGIHEFLYIGVRSLTSILTQTYTHTCKTNPPMSIRIQGHINHCLLTSYCVIHFTQILSRWWSSKWQIFQYFQLKYFYTSTFCCFLLCNMNTSYTM